MENWTEPEQWVWEKVCKGEIANFNEKEGCVRDPKYSTGWTDARLVSRSFLETILLSSAYQPMPSRRGIRIVGAWIRQPIDFTNARISVEWWLDESRFEEDLTLYRAETTDAISIKKSWFAKDLLLGVLQSKSTLYFSNISVEGSLYMNSACVERNIELKGVYIKGKVFMQGITVTRDLWMDDQSVFEGGVSLVCAVVRGQILLGSSKCFGELNMNGIQVGQDLYLSNGEYKAINIGYGRIEGQLEMEELNCLDELAIGGLVVRQDVKMAEAVINAISAINCEIGGQLDMEGIAVTTADLTCLSVTQDVYLYDGRFGEVSLVAARLASELNMGGASIFGKLKMDGISIALDLFMNGVTFGEIQMIGAQINGQLHICNRSQINGALNMAEISVASSLFIAEGTEAGEIKLNGAQIGGSVNLSRIIVKGPSQFNSAVIKRNLVLSEVVLLGSLTMNGLSIGGSLSLLGSHAFEDVQMLTSAVGNSLVVDNIQVAKDFNVRSTSIAQDVLLKSGIFKGEVRLLSCSIQGNFVCTCTDLCCLDLGSTSIQRELRLGDVNAAITWTKDSFLNLRNTKAGALEDGGTTSWPTCLELDGFAYAGLGGGAVSGNGTAGIAKRKAEEFTDWLNSYTCYSSQPYNYLAEILNKMGRSEVANQVLVESKNQERKLAWKHKLYLKWFGMSLLQWTIGYGYGFRYFYSLIWVLALTLLGVWIIGTVDMGEMQDACLADRIGFSLDLLLPVIELNDKYKIDFDGWQQIYFYIHKVMGFVLSSFVLAGLSGITKK